MRAKTLFYLQFYPDEKTENKDIQNECSKCLIQSKHSMLNVEQRKGGGEERKKKGRKEQRKGSFRTEWKEGQKQ